jgi:hypothetical protein
MNKGLHKTTTFIRFNLEALIWIVVLLSFALSPVQSNEHLTLCPLKLVGFEHCPGCGLGRSIILFLHGHFSESFKMHSLAGPAIAILLIRIISILRNYLKFIKPEMKDPSDISYIAVTINESQSRD